MKSIKRCVYLVKLQTALVWLTYYDCKQKFVRFFSASLCSSDRGSIITFSDKNGRQHMQLTAMADHYLLIYCKAFSFKEMPVAELDFGGPPSKPEKMAAETVM